MLSLHKFITQSTVRWACLTYITYQITSLIQYCNHTECNDSDYKLPPSQKEVQLLSNFRYSGNNWRSFMCQWSRNEIEPVAVKRRDKAAENVERSNAERAMHCIRVRAIQRFIQKSVQST